MEFINAQSHVFFFDLIKYGCEIEAEEIDGSLNFIGFYKESIFKTFRYIWSKEIIESNDCGKIKDEIINLGGFWESAMGGIFIIHLPKDKINELDNLLKLLKTEQRTEP